MVQSSKADKERQKIINDKCQALIEVLLKDEDNKYCVDCDAKGPRWASWNLGIFLCIRCAGIHRNLGVHISKVKSVNLDSWGPEHVAYIQRMGNSRARAIYEANLPDDFRRPQTDTALETFVRAKYELKKYIAQGWVDPGPPAPAFDIEEELRRLKEAKRSKNKQNSSSNNGNLIKELPARISQPRHSDQSTANANHQELGNSSSTKQDNNNDNNNIDLAGLSSVAATIAANNSASNGNKAHCSKAENSLLDLFDLGAGTTAPSSSTSNEAPIDPFENFTISSPTRSGIHQNSINTTTTTTGRQATVSPQTKSTTLPNEDLFGAFCQDQSSLLSSQPPLLSSSASLDLRKFNTSPSSLMSHPFGGAPTVASGGAASGSGSTGLGDGVGSAANKKILTKESILSLYSLTPPTAAPGAMATGAATTMPSPFADPFGLRQK